jgi:hypothetical protein
MIFDPTADETDLLQQLTATTSTLMGWFELNREDAFARTLLYQDIPSYYSWQNSHWTKRVYTKVPDVRKGGSMIAHTLRADTAGGPRVRSFASQR